MVRVVYRQPKELVILECTKYASVEALASAVAVVARVGQPVILNWADGVLFSFTPMPLESEWVVRQFLEGRVYWASLIFALMPHYTSTIRVDTVEIPVVDVSPNRFIRRAARWMKKSAERL